MARVIMGRLIDTTQPYQKHRLDEHGGEGYPVVPREWIEFVEQREPHYQQPVVVLVNHCTGSMGEGLAIGLDGMHRAKVIGTKMAGLAGVVYSYDVGAFNGLSH